MNMHVSSGIVNILAAFFLGYFLASTELMRGSSPAPDSQPLIDTQDFTAWQTPFVHTDTTEVTYASHGDKIEKKVVVQRGEIPHINQIAEIKLKPGQVATANHHMDMSEVFFFTKGKGKFTLDKETRAITKGTTVRAMPPHEHEVVNDGTEDLEMFVIAIAHDCPSISKSITAKYSKPAKYVTSNQ